MNKWIVGMLALAWILSSSQAEEMHAFTDAAERMLTAQDGYARVRLCTGGDEDALRRCTQDTGRLEQGIG